MKQTLREALQLLALMANLKTAAAVLLTVLAACAPGAPRFLAHPMEPCALHHSSWTGQGVVSQQRTTSAPISLLLHLPVLGQTQQAGHSQLGLDANNVAGHALRSPRGLSAVDPAAVPVDLDPLDTLPTPTTQLPLQERARQVSPPFCEPSCSSLITT